VNITALSYLDGVLLLEH